jgi:hypothetical protein
MDSISETTAEWRDFYAAVAGVGVTLVGLVYVGISIHMGRQQLETRIRLLGTMSGINLLYPVMAALVILMPLTPRTVVFRATAYRVIRHWRKHFDRCYGSAQA